MKSKKSSSQKGFLEHNLKGLKYLDYPYNTQLQTMQYFQEAGQVNIEETVELITIKQIQVHV